ncbi:unnamed protein product [Vitrella brassicaformis CCMP3155]|uniref:IPT/TIG domain-containing protein n=1 Tax=Vitrella brassicaformis (strain CCMP3155) TaxID=1169540 RepID=A0A0G4EP65_VITBC|nr:unnamed protein product [Vitrella brassicaformis CCMP3155]|eukprot:CEL99219.1 unnamed protein product [Vitrella brassicaformis CCMP3155]
MRIGFAADNAGDFELIVAFMGPDFETRFMAVTGRGVNKGEPHYLHPVLDLPPGGYVVDYDGDGKESLLLMGHFSHTHEPKMSVEKWTYSVNGQVVSSGVDKDITEEYDTGVYTVQLTIEDGEAKTLADTGSVAVVPIDKIPGCAAFLYKPPSSQLSGFFEAPMDGFNLKIGGTTLEPKWIGSSLDNGCEFKPDGRTNNIMGSPFKQDVILRAKGTLKVNDGMKNNKGEVPITVNAEPAVQTMLWVDGKPFALGKGNAEAELANGAHQFEISWLIKDPASKPLSLHTNGEAAAIDEISHSQQEYTPFINRISPTKGHVSGGQKITIEGAGFMNPDAVKRGASLLFGKTPVDYLTDTRVLKASGTEIVYEIPPGEEGELSVSVKTPHGVSNKKRFGYSSRVPPALKWTNQTILLTLDSEAPLKRKRGRKFNGSLTQGEWGPDCRLYMSDIGGGIRALERTSNDDIDEENLIEITTTMEKYPGHAITGFGFDPFGDPDDPEIYVAHAPMFQWGGDCFSQENDTAEFLGVLSKLKGPPDFKHHEVVLDGLPMSNHDHGLNGISFDNSGNLYFPIGAMTNIGWPACILGGLPESHYSAAIIKVELRNPKRSKTLEWVDYFTRELIGNPNQLVADTYDVAPWVTGVYPHSFGFRNAYDTVYTTKGQLWASSNGWNEGYGLAINGPPESGCTFDGWDKSSFASPDRGINPFWKGEKKCRPVLEEDWTDPDRIFQTFSNAYHGLPNAARARNMKDDRQWYVKDADAPHDPPRFHQGYPWESSTNGIAEFRGNCFAGAMRGDLLGAKWSGWIWRVDIPYLDEEEGDDVTISKLEGAEVGGLEVVYGPGCSILTLDYTHNNLKHIMADDEDANSNSGPTAFDITPWRGNYRFAQKIVIGGYNLNGQGETKPPMHRKANKLVIDGVECSITSQSDTRIEGVVPAVESPAHVEELVDVVLHFNDGTESVLLDSWLWADPGDAIN